MKPFIYVASLRRTGSTVLSEALTQYPHSFIFREPALGLNGFNLHPDDAETFRRLGVHIEAFRRRHRIPSGLRRRLGVDDGYMVRAFQRKLLPELGWHYSQVGVKEIFHGGWRHYHAAFPHMKVLITARDPRDIYVSLAHRVRRGQGAWRGPLTPERAAASLNTEFREQVEMMRTVEYLSVRYEDLCTDPALYDKIKRFVESSIPEMGRVGAFNATESGRAEESALHGGRISARQIGRWREEPDHALREAADRLSALMTEYCRFWGYEIRRL